MAASARLLHGGVDSDYGSTFARTENWIVLDASSHDDAELAVASASAANYGNALRRSIKVKDTDATGVYEATVSYSEKASDPPEPETNSYEVSLTVSGSSTHITHSLGVAHTYTKSGYTEIPCGNAINVGDDGIEGCDKLIPAITYSESYKYPHATVSESFVNTLCNTVGKVNASPFRGFAAGSVLASGADLRRTSEDEVSLRVDYQISPNATGLSVGDITGISKGGWQYLSVRSIKGTHESGCPMWIPVQVDIHDIYETA